MECPLLKIASSFITILIKTLSVRYALSWNQSIFQDATIGEELWYRIPHIICKEEETPGVAPVFICIQQPQLNYVFDSLNKAHDAKRILVSASSIYSGKAPGGEEDKLLQYSIQGVNSNYRTVIIDFDNQCIEEDGDLF